MYIVNTLNNLKNLIPLFTFNSRHMRKTQNFGNLKFWAHTQNKIQH